MKQLVIPAAEIRDGRLMLADWQMAAIREMSEKTHGYLQAIFKPPFRPRSTGAKSQSHRINGFIAQIAQATGDDFETVKIRCKQKAISRGWPFITIEESIGGVMHEYRVAMSEADASVEQASILIEAVEQYAAECGVELVE